MVERKEVKIRLRCLRRGHWEKKKRDETKDGIKKVEKGNNVISTENKE